MKKCTLLLLALTLLLGIVGCRQRSEEIQEPVNFYYLTDLTTQDDFDQVIMTEVRESSGYTTDELLDLYLAGPICEGTTNPFPEGLSVVYLRRQGTKSIIILSEQLLQLSGLDLTLACSCLASTMFELYGCQSVEIIVNGHLLDGKTSVVIDREDLVLYDHSYSS